MPRPRKSTPSYLKHASGQARIAWTGPDGVRRFKLLPGPFNSPESLEAFHRLSLELAVRPAAPPTLNTGPTVAEILVAYLKYAEGYYDNAIERRQIKDAVRVVRDLYAATLVADFGPLALKACREAMIRRGWSRRYCNKQTNRVVRLVKQLRPHAS